MVTSDTAKPSLFLNRAGRSRHRGCATHPRSSSGVPDAPACAASHLCHSSSGRGADCARRKCWVTPISPPPRSIPESVVSACATFTVRPTARLGPSGRTRRRHRSALGPFLGTSLTGGPRQADRALRTAGEVRRRPGGRGLRATSSRPTLRATGRSALSTQSRSSILSGALRSRRTRSPASRARSSMNFARSTVPRSVRSKARDLEQAIATLESKNRRAPTDAELAEALGVTEAQLRATLSQVSLAGVAALDEMLASGGPGESFTIGDSIADPEEGPMGIFEAKEMRETLAESIRRMPSGNDLSSRSTTSRGSRSQRSAGFSVSRRAACARSTPRPSCS